MVTTRSGVKKSKSNALDTYKEELRQERKKLKIYRRPFAVLYHFTIVLIRFLQNLIQYVATHKVTQFLVTPLLILWVLATQVEGEHHVYLDRFNVFLQFVIWWVGLGILSSVGLGTGMHSGILFLFPHIFLVVQGAQQCKSLEFDTWHHVWFRPFEADCGDVPDGSIVTFWALLRKVAVPAMLWGAGTAMGEIPPYALSRAAKLAGERDEEFEDITESRSSWNVMNWMKDWMIQFLQNHGFWGVLLMSAWPNMAFDLCGICCGHFLMPFWTFFGATFIGKALIKANLQAMFFITIFEDEHLKAIEKFLDDLLPKSWDIDQKLNDFLLECRKGFHSARDKAADVQTGTASESMISQLGNVVMIALIGYFAISCIEQFAQQHAAEEDEKKVALRASKSE